MASLNPVGTPFIELLTVDSTNNYAIGMLNAGMAQHGTAVFAHEQTNGRGQRGKHWHSAANQNIQMSVVLEPALVTSQMFLLSKMVAIAACRFFNSYAKEQVTIKWPNDLYWRDRKAGGILIENQITGSDWKFAIAGIGINTNQVDFGDLNNKAVSLRQITGASFETVPLAKQLCTYIEEALGLLKHPSQIHDLYKNSMYKLNERVRLKKASRVFDAIIKDVTPAGELVVMHAVEERFAVGEVEWLLE